jgi:hypothetical protein
MERQPIPIVVLAGTDRKPAELPAQGRDKHPLIGYKAVDVRIDGKTLIEAVVERLRDSGWFSPIHIAGPRRVYAEFAGPASIIDTDGSFGDNVHAAVEQIGARRSGTPVAFTVCDILPDSETLNRLMTDYHDNAPCDFWFPMVRAPERRERLGASAWKPVYRIVPEMGQAAVEILPGHLVVADPRALRLRFLYRLIDLGYRTRNRSIDRRRGVMVRGVLTDMLYQDLLHMLRLRLPTLTWSVLRSAIPAARLLREGTITRRGLEETLRKIFVKARHRRAHPERRVVLPIIEALSLARDIDTEEEARELGGRVVH